MTSIKQLKNAILNIWLRLIFFIKKISLNHLINYIYYFFNHKILANLLYMINKKRKLWLKKKYIYRNRKLWKYLNKVLNYKVLNSKYYLEFNTSNKSGSLYLYKNTEGKQKYKNFIRSINNFKSFNLLNNKLKQKLIYKKYWYLWKLKTIKQLRYKRIFLWPLLITIKPYLIIIQNIYFSNYFILKKKKDMYLIKNIYFNTFNKLNNFINIGAIIWYIINKYIYYICNKALINNISQNYNFYLKEQKNIMIVVKNKNYLDKSYFFKVQKIYLKLRNTMFFGRLFFNKLYHLYLFWFLYYYNKLYYYYNNILFNIWIKIYYLNLNFYSNINYRLSNNLYNFSCLYKKILYNYSNYCIIENIYYAFIKNIKFLVLLNIKNLEIKTIKVYNNNKIYTDYNKFFKFLINLNFEKDNNLLDLVEKEDYYKFKDYYKINYFLKNKSINDFKYPELLPKGKNLLFLN